MCLTMKRALIFIVLLALVAPALLFAQGEVTIEGLNNKVHALVADLGYSRQGASEAG